MNKLDLAYQSLLQDILDNGVTKKDRTGTGTISVFGRQIRHKMSEGFPALTTKKLYFKGIVTELLWFLRGDTNIKYLVDNDCHIWDGDAYKAYEKHCQSLGLSDYDDKDTFIKGIRENERYAKQFGNLGPIYGKQWRSWIKPGIKRSKEGIPMGYKIDSIDQITNLIHDLKTNPDSRRLMVNSWNVGELDSMVLPPCHYGFQVYTRELSLEERIIYFRDKVAVNFEGWPGENDVCENFLDERNIPTRAISLMYNARSQDVPLGTPFNIASYAILLEIIGKMVNMVPDELVTNMGDCHIYLNQIEGIKEQLARKPYTLPKLVHMKTDIFYKSMSEDLTLLNHLDSLDFHIEGYKSHPAIKIPLSN
jgi:thymidylate synthase